LQKAYTAAYAQIFKDAEKRYGRNNSEAAKKISVLKNILSATERLSFFAN
jgi:hypothetical protein